MRTNLRHVPCSVGILGSENRPNAKDTLSPTGDLELLVELGRLGEERILTKVCQLEDIGTTFRGCTNETGRLEFPESAFLQV